MFLNKTIIVILFVILCGCNKTWGKGHSHGHGRGHGGSQRSVSSSHSSGLMSSHSRHIGNNAGHSNIHEKTWSSYSKDKHFNNDTSKPIALTTAEYDTFQYSPPNYSVNDYKPVTFENRQPPAADHFIPQSLLVNELDDFITGYIVGKVAKDSTVRDFSKKSALDNDNSYPNYQYSQPYQPPIIIPPSLEKTNKEDIQSYNFKSLNLNMPSTTTGISNSLGVHCQEQMHSEFNERGEIVDSVKKICKPLTPVTTTPQPTTSTSATSTTFSTAKTLETSPSSASKPYAAKEKRYERILAPTLRGFNCRRVMNSELNEIGEILDSVTEICDPPTTTTTTTRKPTLKTTTKRPTITSKPLIKVCRLVMDSYLNEAGEIIDSVTQVCTMEPQK